jgi:hypothetical protein
MQHPALGIAETVGPPDSALRSFRATRTAIIRPRPCAERAPYAADQLNVALDASWSQPLSTASGGASEVRGRVLHDEDHREHDNDNGQPVPCRDPEGSAARRLGIRDF